MSDQEAGCLCNIGAQECPLHPGRTRDKEERIAFRKWWDRQVEEDRER